MIWSDYETWFFLNVPLIASVCIHPSIQQSMMMSPCNKQLRLPIISFAWVPLSFFFHRSKLAAHQFKVLLDSICSPAQHPWFRFFFRDCYPTSWHCKVASRLLQNFSSDHRMFQLSSCPNLPCSYLWVFNRIWLIVSLSYWFSGIPSSKAWHFDFCLIYELM